jgi:hypothetical protein
VRVERLLRKKLTWEDEEEGNEKEETVLNDDMEHCVTVVAPGRRVDHGMVARQDSGSLIPPVTGFRMRKSRNPGRYGMPSRQASFLIRAPYRVAQNKIRVHGLRQLLLAINSSSY